MHRGGKAPRGRCLNCGKKLRFSRKIICRRCYRTGKKRRDWLNRKRKKMP